MKTIKPIMLVVAGMAIAFLVSFKNEEPKKEYASLYYDFSKYVFIHTKENSKEFKYPISDHAKRLEIFNELGAEGWILVAGGNTSLGANVPYIFMRTKQ